MKQLIILFTLSLVINISVFAQDNVGIGTLAPNPNALLDLETSDKGLLIPRLTTAQRIGIAGLGATEQSLLVFDTDLNTFFYWDATQWIGFPLDNDPSNELQDLVFQNDSILISNGTGVDLSGLLLNTDEQSLSWQNDSILISNGVGIDATVMLDNTDEQELALSNDTLYIENANWVYVPDNVDDADANASNELQDLTLQNDSILISNGIGIDVSSLITATGTDDQNLTGATLNAANLLTIDIENGASTSVDLSSLAGGTASMDHDWYEVGTTSEPTNINNNIFTNGKANIGANADNHYSLNVFRNLQVASNFTNVGSIAALGVLVGDMNDVSQNVPGLVVGNNNRAINGRFIFGDDNESIATNTVSAIIGNTDSIISSGNNNQMFIIGKESQITSSGSNNTCISIGKVNSIAASGGQRFMHIQGEFNTITHSGNNNFGYLNGRNNELHFQGSNGYGYGIGNDLYISRPAGMFVFGTMDSTGQASSGFIMGNNITLGRFSDDAVAIGEDIEIDEFNDRNIIIGRKAFTDNNGVMMLTDGYTGATVLTSNIDNSMTTRFAGGYRLFSNHTLTSGVTLAAGGGAWANISDKNKKENYRSIDKQALLASIAEFDIFNWNYKSQEDNIRHIGPFAQDFHQAFQLGTNNTSIVTSDISGVNMVAIQALNENNKVLQAEVQALKAENNAILGQLELLEEKIDALMNAK